MPVNPDTTIRKNVAFPRELWEKVDDYRFSHRIGTESKTVLRLVDLGLGAEPFLRALLAILENAPPIDADEKAMLAKLRQLLGLPERG